MKETLLINFFLGIIGFIFYSLWKSRIYFNSSEGWNFKLFIKENYNQWIFNSIFIIILCIVVKFNPESLNFLKELTGLELSEETINGGFFTIGFLLPSILNSGKKRDSLIKKCNENCNCDCGLKSSNNIK